MIQIILSIDYFIGIPFYLTKQFKEIMSNYPFYIIKSDLPIEEIYQDVLSEYEEYEEKNNVELKKIALIKSIWARGKETDRTLCVFDQKIYDQIYKKEEMDIDYYRVSEYNAPRDGETKNLYIQLPGVLNLLQCQKYINKRMDYLLNYDIWDENDYMITYPNKSRDKNQHAGKAFIVFRNPGESVEKIALTRMFFSGGKWDDCEFRVNCYWARKPVKRIKKHDFPNLSSSNMDMEENNNTKHNSIELPVHSTNNDEVVETNSSNKTENAWKTKKPRFIKPSKAPRFEE